MARGTGSESSRPAGLGSRPNSLGLERRALEELLDELDAGDGRLPALARRRFMRRAFRHVTIPLTLSRPGGSTSSLYVPCRNLSRTGVSVLHSAFQHPGTPCAVVIPRANGGGAAVTGRVARCQHRRGVVHEIGIEFDRPINMDDFVPAAGRRDWFNVEAVEPAELVGTVLYADASMPDRQLFRHYLLDTNLSITTCESAATALERALEGFDLILADAHLPDQPPGGVVGAFRDAGVSSPLVLVTADPAGTLGQPWAAKADAVIAKPFACSVLLRGCAELLRVQAGAKGRLSFCSTLSPEDGNWTLLIDYLPHVHALAERLKRAAEKENAEACAGIFRELRGNAAVMGFPSVAELAAGAAEALSRAGKPSAAAADVARVIDACRRAHARRDK